MFSLTTICTDADPVGVDYGGESLYMCVYAINSSHAHSRNWHHPAVFTTPRGNFTPGYQVTPAPCEEVLHIFFLHCACTMVGLSSCMMYSECGRSARKMPEYWGVRGPRGPSLARNFTSHFQPELSHPGLQSFLKASLTQHMALATTYRGPYQWDLPN